MYVVAFKLTTGDVIAHACATKTIAKRVIGETERHMAAHLVVMRMTDPTGWCDGKAYVSGILPHEAIPLLPATARVELR